MIRVIGLDAVAVRILLRSIAVCGRSEPSRTREKASGAPRDVSGTNVIGGGSSVEPAHGLDPEAARVEVTSLTSLAILAVVVSACTWTSEFSYETRFDLDTGVDSPRTNPQWSPEGDVIAFMYDGAIYTVTSYGSVLQFVDGPASGDEKHRYYKNGYAIAPSISPDGSRIAYASFNGKWEIVTSALDGTERRKITRTSGSSVFYLNPTWSPDGTQIAVVSNLILDEFRRGEEALVAPTILTMTADGSDVRSVAPTIRATLSAPVWSPDGRSLAFIAAGLGRDFGILYTAKTDGSSLSRIGESIDGPPSWSPDGSRIAFMRSDWPDGTTKVYTTDPTGADLTMLHDTRERGAPHFGGPLWSPDGTKILYSTSKFDPAVVVVKADGSEAMRVVEFKEASEVRASWSPDGSRIVVYVSRDEDDLFLSPGIGVILFAMDADGASRHVLAKSRAPTSAGRGEKLESAGGELWPYIPGRIVVPTYGQLGTQPPLPRSAVPLVHAVPEREPFQCLFG